MRCVSEQSGFAPPNLLVFLKNTVGRVQTNSGVSGYGIACLDWGGQEIGVAAGLSRDKTENRENSNPRGFRYGMRKEFRKLAL